jgi:Zn-dependent metalloprotease
MPTTRLLVACCLIGLFSAVRPAEAQTPASEPGIASVHASTPAELRAWDTTIDLMVRDRQLIVVDSRPDPDVEGRRYESLAQYYRGIPVYGGTLTRQSARGVTVSIIGTVAGGIAIDPSPALSADQAVLSLAATSDGRVVGRGPQLVVFPTVGGEYRLAYRITLSDMKSYVVDAASGAVLWIDDEIQTQHPVGVGTGALGDRKKISTTQAGGGFRTHDQHRPAQIRTLDTRGSNDVLNRLLLPPGAAVDGDFPVDSDNTWTDAPIVDAHVHAGWTQDYLFKQVGWTGVDNRRGTITSAVHSGLTNNAFFTPPPFGADGRGMFVYGRTPAGGWFTTLDIVAHETMHGVTHAALTQRTGAGLLNALVTDRFGPTTITSGGSSFSCETSEVVRADGTRLPFFCNGGRFVLLSNHPGAINEAFSDVLGIATEFFHQPTGPGQLQADYKMGEDVPGSGAARAADSPASLTAMPSSHGPIAYPDHVTRSFSFLVAVTQGTRTNPTAVLILPWVLIGNELVTLPATDNGGVHVNATILSHAFYLAIEGGRNATSGVTVQGVGAANRLQVERAFFRAMTVLMPNLPTMQTAAQTIVQASADLHGAGAAPTVAIRQALQAVGLIN